MRVVDVERAAGAGEGAAWTARAEPDAEILNSPIRPAQLGVASFARLRLAAVKLLDHRRVLLE